MLKKEVAGIHLICTPIQFVRPHNLDVRKKALSEGGFGLPFSGRWRGVALRNFLEVPGTVSLYLFPLVLTGVGKNFGMTLFMYSSNFGTVKALSPYAGA